MSDETWDEPARSLPVIGRPDVLVVGGGSAGVAAAVAAARAGATTWLIEGSSTLGGLATVGLINLLLTLDDGAGQQVVAGLCQELVDRLVARGSALHPPQRQWNDDDPAAVDEWRQWGLVWGAPPEAVRYSVAFDPDAFVDVAYEWIAEAGVRLQLQTWFAGVALSSDARIEAVYLESKRGREVVRPSVVVDATGDGDVAVAAGAPFEQVSIPPHLWFRAGGVGDDLTGSFAFRTVGSPGRVLVPWGPGPERVDACDPDSVTRAMVECRAGARREFERLRRDAPGFAAGWLDGYATLGITESRRLVGDHVLTKEDGDVRFPDAVARTGHWTRRGVVFDIPFRSMTTAAVANLVVAGRCISTSRYVHQATKEIPACMATGEAAGVAAAHAASAGDLRQIDIAGLRTALTAAAAIV